MCARVIAEGIKFVMKIVVPNLNQTGAGNGRG
jgi:hypothetical protein